MQIKSVRLDPNDGGVIAIGEYQIIEQKPPYPFLVYRDGELLGEYANLGCARRASAFAYIKNHPHDDDPDVLLWEFQT